MQRMSINIDLNSNEILNEELNKIIEGAVKERGRKAVNDFIDEQVDRRIQLKFKELRNGQGKNDNLTQLINYRVDSLITKELMGVKLSELHIEQKILSKVNDIEMYIPEILNKILLSPEFTQKIDEMMKQYVKQYVTNTLLEIITNYNKKD